MRVLAAPDKFKGTLTASEVAAAIAVGWQRGAPESVVDAVPIADGGEGTLDTIVEALGGETRKLSVTGPLGDRVEADFGLARGSEGPIAVVEMARASGLAIVPEERRKPLRATTYGTGELIREASRHRPRRLIVCIGGSATNDAGAGMAQALGIRLLDEEERDLPPGGAALRSLARIDASGLDSTVRDVPIVAAVDVDNPLTGPQGASAVYGPQKGASPQDVALLDQALGHFAAIVHRDLGIDLHDVPGAGAAGGLGGGLVAFLGARLRPGFDVVAEALDLDRRTDRADVVVTGEGRFDSQSLRGKAPVAMLRLAAESGRTSVLVAGDIEAGVVPPADLVFDLTDRFGREAALERAGELVEQVAEEAASLVGAGRDE
jgi:glycerate kinase